MPTADFFARLGLFIDPDFCPVDLRRAILTSARTAEWDRAVVYGTTARVDEDVRKTLMVRVPKAERAALAERLLALKPALEDHFGLRLSGCQEPQLLCYREGNFFTPHRDRSLHPGGDPEATDRQLSCVLFLNDQTAEPTDDSFCGGALTFYGLMDDPRAREYGFPLTGKAGLLVAFRSDVIHEVKPVTHGERYTVVCWYV